MARSIERVIEDAIREMDNASMYDSTFDYEFEEALIDWDEREPVNRPLDDEDSWEENCVSEKEWKRRNDIYLAEWKKEQAEIKERYRGVKPW